MLGESAIAVRPLGVVADASQGAIGNPRHSRPLGRRARQHNSRRSRIQHQLHGSAVHQHLQAVRARVRGVLEPPQRNLGCVIGTGKHRNLAAIQRLRKLHPLAQLVRFG